MDQGHKNIGWIKNNAFYFDTRAAAEILRSSTVPIVLRRFVFVHSGILGQGEGLVRMGIVERRYAMGSGL